MLIPDPLIIFLVSIAPMIDRGAIPLGVFGYQMPLMNAFLIFIFGNIGVSMLIYYGLDSLCAFARKHSKFLDDALTELFRQTRKDYGERMHKLGLMALFLFVALPIPGGGSYAGALVAYVFDVKPKKAAPILISGLTLAGLFIGLGTAGLIPLVAYANPF